MTMTWLQNEFYQSLLLTGGATLSLALTLYLMAIIFPWVINRVQRSKRIPSITVKGYEIVSHQSIATGLVRLLRGLRYFGTLFFIYFYFSLVFGFFDETRFISDNMLAYILDPIRELVVTVINYVPKAIYILIIAFIVRYLLKVIRLFFDRVENGYIKFEGFHADWASPTYNLVRILVFCFTLIILFPHLPGSSSPAFQGISVFLGLLISLGSGSAISNLVSGIVITYMRPFQVGDRVKIGETIGDIREKNLLVTRIRTIKNVDITIPNSMVLNSHIMNYSSAANNEGLILNIRLHLDYQIPWNHIHNLLLTAAGKTEGVLDKPKPFIFQTALKTAAVEYELNVYIRDANVFDDIYSNLYQNILDVFSQAKVELVCPDLLTLTNGEPAHIVGAKASLSETNIK